MRLESMLLRNVRLHGESSITFTGGSNYIVGGNGQGKTTILEAIYFLCTTRNYKSATDAELVMFGEEMMEITGVFQDAVKNKVKIFYTPEQRKKQYFLDKKQIHRAADVIGKFPVILLTPDDHNLTQGYANDRRKFVDSTIAQASDVYLNLLLDYNKTLRQRANLLQQIKETGNPMLKDQLDAWDAKLAGSGLKLIDYRREFVKEFSSFVADAYNEIMETKEIPQLIYDTIGRDGLDVSLFLELLRNERHNEIRRKTNLVGPHKDDFIFEINGKNLKKFGSQGQHKTFQVALRFAQFFYIKNKLGRTPIFLLDDVFGELDTERAVKISEFLREVGQAFVTLTDFSNFSFLKKAENDTLIYVNNGTVGYG